MSFNLEKFIKAKRFTQDFSFDLVNNQLVIKPASTLVGGKVQLADIQETVTGTDAAKATTSAGVKAAITAAIAAIPGDKYLSGLQSYNEVTNIMTLSMSDGTTVAVDMTNLLADAVASQPTASTAAKGVIQLATPAEVVAGTDDAKAVTSAGVKAAIEGAAPDGSETQLSPGTNITITGTGTEADPYVINSAGGVVPDATNTVKGIVALAAAADYPQTTNDTDATTPAYVEAAIIAGSGGGASVLDAFGS